MVSMMDWITQNVWLNLSYFLHIDCPKYKEHWFFPSKASITYGKCQIKITTPIEFKLKRLFFKKTPFVRNVTVILTQNRWKSKRRILIMYGMNKTLNNCQPNDALVPLDYPWWVVMVRKKRTFLLLPLLALSNDFLLCKYNKEVRDCQRRKNSFIFWNCTHCAILCSVSV